MKNAPPPYLYARAGNLQMLPIQVSNMSMNTFSVPLQGRRKEFSYLDRYMYEYSPKPTAAPIAARRKAARDDHDSRPISIFTSLFVPVFKAD
jgi:hypothetical protein